MAKEIYKEKNEMDPEVEEIVEKEEKVKKRFSWLNKRNVAIALGLLATGAAVIIGFFGGRGGAETEALPDGTILPEDTPFDTETSDVAETISE